MSIPTVIELTSVPTITASWSERNGGQIFLLGGGVRGILSRDAAQAIVDQLTRALDTPRRSAEIAARDALPELERVPDADTRIGETLRSRKAALITAYPEKGRRLLALYGVLADAGAGAEVVMIDGTAFTCDEARELVIALERDLHRTLGRPD